MLSRQRQGVAATLGENVNAYDPQTQSVMAQLQAGFMAAGADATVAAQRAYVAMYGMVQRQAAMVSFVSIFRTLGMIFIVLIPLVLIMKRPPKRPGGPMAAHCARAPTSSQGQGVLLDPALASVMLTGRMKKKAPAQRSGSRASARRAVLRK